MKRALEKHWELPTILLAITLIAGAVVRFYYADANSYWLDELYSVVVYGIAHDSVAGAIKALTRSIHPPLYQFILYNWMAVFGDSETATRSLSNLYVVGATLCLYLSVRKLYGPWLGVIVALVFTLMFTPTYYGMETRSYAQTIFLSSLSTLLLIHALPRIAGSSWREMIRDVWILAFLVANAALLMTHYYNVFFLGAQGLFLILYLLLRCSRPVEAITKSLAVGFFPVLVLLIVWGSVMLRSYSKHADSYAVETLPKVPWETLSRLVIEPNFGIHETIYFAVLLSVVIVSGITLVRLFNRPNEETVFTLWFLFAAVVPALLAFLLFFLSGHERYSVRYFSFSVGPLAVLVVLGIYQAATLLFSRITSSPSWVALLATAVLSASLAYPGGLQALKWSKQDWRGIAKAIVERVGREPDKRFVVYETTFRKYPTLDYYLGRYSDSIRVRRTLRRGFEKGRRSLQFTRPSADYAVVAFTHHKASSYPKTLAVLGEKMTLAEKELDKYGRGYLVYSIPK